MFTRKNIMCALLIGCTLQTSARANIVPALGCAIGITAGTLLYKNPQWRAMTRKKLSTNDKVLWALHALGGAITGVGAGVLSHYLKHLLFVFTEPDQQHNEARLTESYVNAWLTALGTGESYNNSFRPQKPVRWLNDAHRRAWNRAEHIFLERLKEREPHEKEQAEKRQHMTNQEQENANEQERNRIMKQKHKEALAEQEYAQKLRTLEHQHAEQRRRMNEEIIIDLEHIQRESEERTQRFLNALKSGKTKQ